MSQQMPVSIVITYHIIWPYIKRSLKFVDFICGFSLKCGLIISHHHPLFSNSQYLDKVWICSTRVSLHAFQHHLTCRLPLICYVNDSSNMHSELCLLFVWAYNTCICASITLYTHMQVFLHVCIHICMCRDRCVG